MAVKVGRKLRHHQTANASTGRMIERWKEELRKLTGARGGASTEVEGQVVVHLTAGGQLIRGLGKPRGGDPGDGGSPKWIRDGVPLGINKSH